MISTRNAGGLLRLVACLPLLASGAVSAGEIDVRGVAALRPAVQQALAREHFDALALGERVAVRGLPVGDVRLDLELERFDVWTDDAVFLVDDIERARPGIVLMRGTVAGDASSRVVIGLGDHAVNGFIQHDGRLYSVSNGAPQGVARDADLARDVLITDLAKFDFAGPAFRCGIDGNLAAFAPHGVPAPAPRNAAPGPAPCRVVRVAIDTDWEWSSERFGGNADAAAEYALLVTAAVSEIFRNELNVRLVVPFLRTWSADVDPYNGTATPDPLDQLRGRWSFTMGHIERDLTHLFTGVDTVYGGVAYLATMCSEAFGYGVSAYMNGSFPYPLQNYNAGNWDLLVMAHELGHNFGAIHTHEFNPPIDFCGIDCSGNVTGTIMSYCHGCAGGMNNVALGFHEQVRASILNYLEFGAPCSLEPVPQALPDTAATFQEVAIEIPVVINDVGPGCEPPAIASVQSPTEEGGAATITAGSALTGATITYIPAPGFTGLDIFTYTTSTGHSAEVQVTVDPLRAAESVPNLIPGLRASYYQLNSGVTALPDFNDLTPIEEKLVSALIYFSSGGSAVGSSLSDFVGAVFDGYVVAPTSGLYTFTLESDDGSRLIIGDEIIVDNDGLHGMVAVSGQIGLAQGVHPVRIEYFEYTGGAGLFFRWSGPGAGPGIVPANALRHSPPCGPADVASPIGLLNNADVLAAIDMIENADPSLDLAEPFGQVDAFDLIMYLRLFDEGCP